MNKILLLIRGKIESFSLRERILFFASAVVVIYLIWSTVLDSLFVEQDLVVERNVKSMQEQNQLLEVQLGTITDVLGKDTTAFLAKKAMDLKKDNNEIQEKIISETKKLVSPKEMINVLKEIIEESQGITILKMESTATEELFSSRAVEVLKTGQPQDNKAINPGAEIKIFKHGLKVEMLGNFFATVQFLRELEKENLNMFWDEIDYEVLKYPQAKITLFVHTLSLERGWIGV